MKDTNHTKIDDLHQGLKKSLDKLCNINEQVKEAIEPHVTNLLVEGGDFKLKGNEVVGWLGELYAATVLGGKIESDDKSYDVLVGDEQTGDKIEVKTRRQPNEKNKSWKRSGVISVSEDEEPTHLVFVKLKANYQLESMYKFNWEELKKSDRLKVSKSNGNHRGYYIVLAPTTQKDWMLYPEKGSKWLENATN